MVFALSQIGEIAPKAIGQTLSCPSNIIDVTDAGLCSAVVTYAAPVASNYCATSSLSLGDITFTGYIDDGQNEYSFVLLVDIPSGTTIHFTDRGWKAGGGFRNASESIAHWTSTTALAAGTEVEIDDLTASVGSMSGDALQLSSLGDQIFAYKGAPPTATNQSNFLAAIQMNGEWDAGASENRSAKPSVFTDGVNSISIYPEKDNAIYNCTLTTGSPSQLRADINNQSNWTSTNNINNLNQVPSCGFTVYCTPTISLLEGQSSGSSFAVGTTTVKYRATYGDGMTADCSFTVAVEDNVAAVATCQNVTVQLDASGNGSTSTGAVDNGSSDACGIASLSLSEEIFDCTDVGANTVTLTVTDNNDNISSCNASVTVEDNQAPIFTNCPSNITVANDSGECGAIVNWAPPKIQDNCPGGTAQSSYSPGDFFAAEQTTTVTYTAIDAAGNSAVPCSFTITVEDEEAPNAVCISKTIALDPNGSYWLTEGDVLNNNASTDNCSDAFFQSFDVEELTCDDVNTTVPVWVEVEDAAGNSVACTAYISVEEGTNLPSPWANSDINPAGGSAIYEPCAGEKFTLESTGPNYGSEDRHHFAYIEICGDGEIKAHVRSVSDGGSAGIQMRESLDPGAKKVAIKTKYTTRVYREYRVSTGGNQVMTSVRRSNQYWLRVKRTGNVFKAYTSSNGSSWRLAYQLTGQFASCLKVGIFASGRSKSSLTTAVFDQVRVSGAVNQALQNANRLPLTRQEADEFEAPITTISSPSSYYKIQLPTDEMTEIGVPNVTIFPNPASQAVKVSFTGLDNQATHLLIQDNFGRKLKKIDVGSNSKGEEMLDIRDLVPGLYIIQVVQNGQLISTKKLIVN